MNIFDKLKQLYKKFFILFCFTSRRNGDARQWLKGLSVAKIKIEIFLPPLKEIECNQA